MNIFKKVFSRRKKEKPVFIRLLEYGEEIGLSGTNVDKTVEWGIPAPMLQPLPYSPLQVLYYSNFMREFHVFGSLARQLKKLNWQNGRKYCHFFV